MALRVLVDENTSPRLVGRLQDSGHTSIHVLDALREGVSDEEIASYAEDEEYAILTHDDDYLSPKHRHRAPILYYHDDSMTTDELAQQVLTLGKAVRSNEDLGDVTYLGQW
jgi:predicted nuclease of predicted toxin-antitoxin system